MLRASKESPWVRYKFSIKSPAIESEMDDLLSKILVVTSKGVE